MAIAAIYIYLLFALVIFILSLIMEDATLGVFSALLIIIGGLNIIINGFQDFVQPYTMLFGIILTTFGSYVAIRAGVEVIENTI